MRDDHQADSIPMKLVSNSLLQLDRKRKHALLFSLLMLAVTVVTLIIVVASLAYGWRYIEKAESNLATIHISLTKTLQQQALIKQQLGDARATLARLQANQLVQSTSEAMTNSPHNKNLQHAEHVEEQIIYAANDIERRSAHLKTQLAETDSALARIRELLQD